MPMRKREEDEMVSQSVGVVPSDFKVLLLPWWDSCTNR